MRPGLAVLILWVGFGLSWALAARWSSDVNKRLGLKREISYRIFMLVGAGLLAVPAHGYEGPLRLWMVTRGEAWASVAAIAAGLAFCWWARVHLGTLWSGQITTKKDHAVVDTGPYGIVRHPIYTGLLLAIFATAAIKGTIPGLAGALVAAIGIWMKARLEETWLATELGQDAYANYRRRVPMLVPFGPRG